MRIWARLYELVLRLIVCCVMSDIRRSTDVAKRKWAPNPGKLQGTARQGGRQRIQTMTCKAGYVFLPEMNYLEVWR